MELADSVVRWQTEVAAMGKSWHQLRELLRQRAYQRGQFRLSSGRVSPYYIDGRLITLWPEGCVLVGDLCFHKLRGRGLDAVGGLTLGADPMVTAIAYASHQAGEPLPAFIVRKEAKEHGRQRQIEGPPLERGMRVAIVDDALTTGGSALQAIEAVEAIGCVVATALVLVDRLEGGREVLAQRGYRLESVFTIHDIDPSLAQAPDPEGAPSRVLTDG